MGKQSDRGQSSLYIRAIKWILSLLELPIIESYRKGNFGEIKSHSILKTGAGISI